MINKLILVFTDAEIEKHKFQYFRYTTDIKKLAIDKIMISKKVSFVQLFQRFQIFHWLQR